MSWLWYEWHDGSTRLLVDASQGWVAIALVLAVALSALACYGAFTGKALRDARKRYEDVAGLWYSLPVPVRLQAERARYMRDTHYPSHRLHEEDVTPTWLLEELLAERMRVPSLEAMQDEAHASWSGTCIDCPSRQANHSRCRTCPFPDDGGVWTPKTGPTEEPPDPGRC